MDTIPLPTYLIAFMVTDFNSTCQQLKNVKICYWARKDAMGQLQVVSEKGPKLTEFFENFFNIKFPLPKYDLVAIPGLTYDGSQNAGVGFVK